jgi:uncharacterized protein (DUF2147 family)
MKALLAMGFGALALVTVSASASAGDPYGVWVMDNGKVTLKIVDCGGKLCANIVGLKEPTRNGKPKVDRHNENEKLRSRPLMGLQVVSGLKPKGADKWEGRIYNPDDGKTYGAKVTLVDQKTMKLKGCVLGVLCKTSRLYRSN